MRLALLACLLLTACNTITPGLTLTCDGLCHLAPANVSNRPTPDDLRRPRALPERP